MRNIYAQHVEPEMAALSAAELLQRSEALVDGKKINEAIDVLNGLGMYVANSI